MEKLDVRHSHAFCGAYLIHQFRGNVNYDLCCRLNVLLNVGKVCNPTRYNLYGTTLRAEAVTYSLLTLFKLFPRQTKGVVLKRWLVKENLLKQQVLGD